MATDSEKNYKEKVKQARIKVLEMIHKAGTSHIASNFSVIDIATVLYENLKEGDEVVWSKGWASATIYYFLAQQGKIPKEDLELFGKEVIKEIRCWGCNGTKKFGNADNCPYCMNKGFLEEKKVKYLGLAETSIPGVLCNGGSMGHGLPIACGMALAKKLKGEEGKVYCIMSDGEMNEGTTWECAMFASHHKLDNLVVIVDRNKWQAMGKCEEVLSVNLNHAFDGFRWEIYEIPGHSFGDINFALAGPHGTRPKVIVAETIKGKGVSFFENHLLYHYKHVDEEEYLKAKAELEQ